MTRLQNKQHATRSQAQTTTPHTAAVVDLEEHALLRRVALQDQEAFETLYTRYAPLLRVYLARRLWDDDMVDEVLNDVMLVVWQQPASRPTTVPLAAWLYGIARYKVCKARARAAREIPGTPESISPAEDPEQCLLNHDQERTLERALTTLPPAERTVVALLVYRGLSYQEIATEMGTPINTVKTRLLRARGRLATCVATLATTAA